MNCVVCGCLTEDLHGHVMSSEFLTKQAEKLKDLEEKLSYCHCCRMQFCECHELEGLDGAD